MARHFTMKMGSRGSGKVESGKALAGTRKDIGSLLSTLPPKYPMQRIVVGWQRSVEVEPFAKYVDEKEGRRLFLHP